MRQPPGRSCRMETVGSPRFLGNPCARALLPGPRRDLHARPITAFRCCLPRLAPRRLPQLRFLRGSIAQPAHLLSTLRSAGHPNTTQDLLPGGRPTLPGRDSHPLGFNERFQLMHPPFPDLTWRKPNEANFGQDRPNSLSANCLRCHARGLSAPLRDLVRREEKPRGVSPLGSKAEVFPGSFDLSTGSNPA